LYPSFINSKKSREEGRRLSKEKGVDNPTIHEINDVIAFEGLQTKIEKNKMYTRDPLRDPVSQGRVRVQLKNDDGTFVNEKFKSRHALLLHAAECIPKLKSRLPGAQSVNTSGGQVSNSSGGTGGSGSSTGGGGKKKKR